MKQWIQDAGHGGSDPGAVYDGQKEKEWTLEAALYVNSRLNELGISSSTTRTSDVTLTRKERTNKVKRFQKCISHHFNAGGGAGSEFIHSIYSDGSFENKLANEFKQEGYAVRRVFNKRYPNRNDLDYYYMHRDTGKCRTTIVEYDFLDGDHRNKLQDKDYRIGMYECVIKAICSEEGVTYQSKNSGISESILLYRVISGSFKDLKNAEFRVQELKHSGFDAFIDHIKM